ncbi:ArsB/NhaD family transporter [Conexibacter sp. JD483]|uniref:SLC13 family permease n=1 Tax=unclassified Conexibacter TaxID=2627773 RepID=UPI00271EFC2A|nr:MULTISPECIES: SLC13 family permease [unclassified Conexibacter]MDO8184161.1 ArsB/NhaD family transporter [Conexibacter sp. CPCC 205706]MDO8197153.1 ArsB/NhaD family transporter [Conexibacter sp. CPCC 205762]MDR9367532.1 ArsB/NhaD family transporter [Conexibacter sp. JD483]
MSVGDEVHALAPTLAFLAAVLVLGHLCEREGLFAAAGRLLARRSGGRPQRLLALVFALAAAVTAVLGLDATVVLLTPVVLGSASLLGLRARPHLYACVHLANAASLLLPVANLTNLLAFHEAGIGFLEFTALMALPQLVVLAVEWIAFRRFFARELAEPPTAPAPAAALPAAAPAAGSAPPAAAPAPDAPHDGAPLLAAAVVAATLVGFVLSTPLGIDPAWVAAAGALVLAVPALAQGRTSLLALAKAASPGFLVGVMALGVAVAIALSLGLDEVVDAIVPHGDGLPQLLGVTAVAALLANLVNNLPATLILLPALAERGTPALLAALVGVNVGPNLTYAGSLATLLWKRVLRESGDEAARDGVPALATFTRLGLVTVIPGLLLGTTALWLALAI